LTNGKHSKLKKRTKRGDRDDGIGGSLVREDGLLLSRWGIPEKRGTIAGKTSGLVAGEREREAADGKEG